MEERAYMDRAQVVTALVMGEKMFTIEIPYASLNPGIHKNENMPGTFYCALDASIVDRMEFPNVILLRNALEEILSLQEKKKFLLGNAEYSMDLLGNTVVLCYFAEALNQNGNYFQVH
jgi:hypothetical protein